MIQKVLKNLSLFSMTFLFLVFPLISGCQIQNETFLKHRAFFFKVNKLVFTGFKPALLPGDEPRLIRDAISGAVFMAEPVPQHVADMMTDLMFEKLIADGEYDLISPDQAILVNFNEMYGNKYSLHNTLPFITAPHSFRHCYPACRSRTGLDTSIALSIFERPRCVSLYAVADAG